MITIRGKPPRLSNRKNDYHSGQGPIAEIVKTITIRGKPPRLRNCKNDYHSGQGPILEIVKTITHQGKQQNHIRISMFMLMRIFL